MIRVLIGGSERKLESVSENWVNQQIDRRQKSGESVCVRVIIRKPSVQMTLSTLTCPQVEGRKRPPNREEKEIFDLWVKRGLNKEDFHGGNLVAFLKQFA